VRDLAISSHESGDRELFGKESSGRVQKVGSFEVEK